MRPSQCLLLTCALVAVGWAHSSRGQAAPLPLTFDDPTPQSASRPASAQSGSSSFRPAKPLTLTPSAPADAGDQNVPLDPIYACACGCNVFEVGTSSMLPQGQGGMIWGEWDYQDQNHNRHGSSSAPAADNDDKDLRTNFYSVGLQYFFDRKWGVQAEVPFAERHFQTGDGTTDWTSMGDVRLKGIYTGFFPDQSVGIDFGVKFPTGDFNHHGADRDTEIGTGSTDLLLGAFYRTNLTADHNWNFFAQVEADLPVLIQDKYRPGFEADAAAGIYYSGFVVHGVRISPIAQAIFSYRASDGGDNSAHPVASGYQRVLLSPGLELDLHPFSIYGDVEIPVYQYYRGDQLSASAMFKVLVTYHF